MSCLRALHVSRARPAPIYVGFAVSNGQVIIAASPQNLLTTKVLDDLINGVIDVDTEPAEWVIGAL